MDSSKKGFETIDEYIHSFPAEVQSILEEIRKTIKAIVPDAEEKISYQMPTFYLNGNLVHFAAFKNHIGFYPTPSGITEFEKELSVYKSAKGSAQFPITEPMPLDLIRKMVQYRADENRKLVKGKKKKG